MKTLLSTYLPTMLRHCFTALAGLGAYLSTKGLIDPTDAVAVDTAGGTIATGLVVILTAILARLALMLLAKTKISGVVTGLDKVPAWALWIGMGSLSGFLMLGSAGCSTTLTKTTMPDGTVIEVTAKASDPVAIRAAVDISGLLMPLVVRATK